VTFKFSQKADGGIRLLTAFDASVIALSIAKFEAYTTAALSLQLCEQSDSACSRQSERDVMGDGSYNTGRGRRLVIAIREGFRALAAAETWQTGRSLAGSYDGRRLGGGQCETPSESVG